MKRSVQAILLVIFTLLLCVPTTLAQLETNTPTSLDDATETATVTELPADTPNDSPTAAIVTEQVTVTEAMTAEATDIIVVPPPVLPSEMPPPDDGVITDPPAFDNPATTYFELAIIGAFVAIIAIMLFILSYFAKLGFAQIPSHIADQLLTALNNQTEDAKARALLAIEAAKATPDPTDDKRAHGFAWLAELADDQVDALIDMMEARKTQRRAFDTAGAWGSANSAPASRPLAATADQPGEAATPPADVDPTIPG